MSSDPTPLSFHELAVLWRNRVTLARQDYDSAADHASVASKEFLQGHRPTPDGGLHFRQLILAECSAREEYMRVLRIFTNLIVSGKEPPEN